MSLTDGWFFVQAGLITSFVDDSSVELGLAWAEGGADSEFGNVPAHLAGTLTVRVFF